MKISFICSVYVNNSCPGGTVGIAFINVNFAGTSVFKHNMGPGLRVYTFKVMRVACSLFMHTTGCGLFGRIVSRSNSFLHREQR